MDGMDGMDEMDEMDGKGAESSEGCEGGDAKRRDAASTYLGRAARAGIIVGLIVSAATLSSLAGGNAVGARHTVAARQLMRVKNGPGAAEALRRALQASPDNPVALGLQGRLRLLSNNREGAIEPLRRAGELSQRPADPLRLLGSILVAMPDHGPKAVPLFEWAVVLAPPPPGEAPHVWARLGEAARDAGFPATSVWALRRAEAAGPFRAERGVMLAEVYGKLGLSDAQRATVATYGLGRK